MALDMRRAAAAASEICDDVPAVWTPSVRATGASWASDLQGRLSQPFVLPDATAWYR